ncbi:MAG: hypothetical protein ACP5I1_03215, partial [Candidatus Hinthialibacter sp.]
MAIETPVWGEDQPNDPWRSLQTVKRGIPAADGHPGNIYLTSESVIIHASPPIPDNAVRWQLLDDRRTIVQQGELNPDLIKASALELGKLNLGWYRLEFLDENGACAQFTTAAVLQRLFAPVPQDSPICIDGANAWFAQENPSKQEDLSKLAALAGVNWIRDRLRWRDIQTGPDEWAENTTYDTSAQFENQYGLKVLQVFHDTPEWAVEDPTLRGRMPEDLRILYRFCQAMSQRFHGLVQAWEPWNEANAPDFGGHTADEMCSMQKAAYLGFKAGDPDVTVGWNAYAGVPTPLHTKVLLANEAWSYFDTYNIHTYDWPSSYMKLRQPVFEAACGRPIWVTESDRGIQYETGEPWFDLSQENERKKAEFIAQSYATSLFAGCNRHFHFILGHYHEARNNIQFGMLRLDLTPRPAYSALAAAARFLAGAQCLGRMNLDQSNGHVYAFRAQPDGVERDVLVAWAEKEADWPDRGKTTVDWPFERDMPIQGIYDYFGRPFQQRIPEKLRSSAVFILLPPNGADQLPLEKPPVSEYREGSTSTVVMQLALPRDHTVRVTETPWSVENEHRIQCDVEKELPLYVYNLSDQTASGTIQVEHLPK